MVHGHGGVVIGSEMSGGVRNVVIANCVFVGTDRGIRLKSRRGRGGVVEDIRVSNVLMEDVLCPFIMNLYYGCGAWGAERISDKQPYPVNEGTPRFRRIQFNGVTARRVRYAAALSLWPGRDAGGRGLVQRRGHLDGPGRRGRASGDGARHGAHAARRFLRLERQRPALSPRHRSTASLGRPLP